MADAMVAYAQPMLDETDGSEEQVNKTFSIAHVCWNLALLPENEREEGIAKIRKTFEEADEAEFANFRQSIIEPMIRRQHEMFPNMAPLDSQATAPRPPEKKYPGTGRNAPCPCGSGKKYKKCCGK